MSLGLHEIRACFAGVIPSIIATASPDGVPNISYLSHVELVDAEHVALSNQFFSKTAANARENPKSTLLLVDPSNGAQYILATEYVRSMDDGPLFEAMSIQLRASSAQVGMSGVMRLRAIDIYRVLSIGMVPAQKSWKARPVADDGHAHLSAAAIVAHGIAEQPTLDAILDAALDGIRGSFGIDNVIILLRGNGDDRLVTVGSRGYPRSGIGSEVLVGDGIVGTAVAERCAVRINDVSRIRRFGAAVLASTSAFDENETRAIDLPSIAEPMSQLALPLIAGGKLRGVLFFESVARFAFPNDLEMALSMVAAHLAAAIALTETGSLRVASRVVSAAQQPEPASEIRVTYYIYDDSVFINDQYLIKGIPGRLLIHLIQLYLDQGRDNFTNREMRLTSALRLPEFKDNLETRLLLLRRRLEEKRAPVQLRSTGRGQLKLELFGPVLVTRVARGVKIPRTCFENH